MRPKLALLLGLWLALPLSAAGGGPVHQRGGAIEAVWFTEVRQAELWFRGERIDVAERTDFRLAAPGPRSVAEAPARLASARRARDVFAAELELLRAELAAGDADAGALRERLIENAAALTRLDAEIAALERRLAGRRTAER